MAAENNKSKTYSPMENLIALSPILSTSIVVLNTNYDIIQTSIESVTIALIYTRSDSRGGILYFVCY